MITGTKRRVFATMASGAAVALALTACSSSTTTSTSTGTKSASAECAPYAAYGDLTGKSISVYTGIVTPEDQPYMDSYKPFESCTGAKVNYVGDKAFETQILVRAKAGNPPDIAIVPQPGLLQQLVATGAAKEAPRLSPTTSTSSGALTGRATARSVASSTPLPRVRA